MDMDLHLEAQQELLSMTQTASSYNSMFFFNPKKCFAVVRGGAAEAEGNRNGGGVGLLQFQRVHQVERVRGAARDRFHRHPDLRVVYDQCILAQAQYTGVVVKYNLF